MNWFTKTNIEKRSIEFKIDLIGQDSCCSHVEANPELAAYVHCEQDSFGPVSTHVCCNDCHAKSLEEEGNVEERCNDCDSLFKMKDGIAWKWYDFYAPQGDEPIYICNSCKVKDKHKQRVAKDDLNYREEMGYDEVDDDNDD